MQHHEHRKTRKNRSRRRCVCVCVSVWVWVCLWVCACLCQSEVINSSLQNDTVRKAPLEEATQRHNDGVSRGGVDTRAVLTSPAPSAGSIHPSYKHLIKIQLLIYTHSLDAVLLRACLTFGNCNLSNSAGKVSLCVFTVLVGRSWLFIHSFH